MPPIDGQPVLPEIVLPAQPRAEHPLRDVYHFHDPCVLGTRMNLLVRADGQDAAYTAACAARAEIDRLARVFDWRDPASELSRLNRSAVHQASTELFEVVAAAERWRALSGGAYSGRLGLLLAVWRMAQAMPDRGAMQALAQDIDRADVQLAADARTISRPPPVRFDLDGIAKGYIVDRALQAMRSSPGVTAAMTDIGGDIRSDGDWRVDLPEPMLPFDNAPACGAFALNSSAIATSGCGPRDRQIGGRVVSATIDPRSGWPVAHRRSATAIAGSAMDADALATAMLVSSPAEAHAMLVQAQDLAARVATPEGAAWFGEAPHLFRWIDDEAPQQGEAAPYRSGWEEGWIANITFEAPPKDMRREIAFRSPYVAIWVSDEAGRPVRTLLLIGRHKDWHEGNHIWWRQNRAKVDAFFAGRSMSTRGSGTYKVYWDGIDDDGKPVTPGRYIMHVETSREGGGHTHRTLTADFTTMRRFEAELPIDPQSGGLLVSFEGFGVR